MPLALLAASLTLRHLEGNRGDQGLIALIKSARGRKRAHGDRYYQYRRCAGPIVLAIENGPLASRRTGGKRR